MDATLWTAEAQILQLQNAYLALRNIASLFPSDTNEIQAPEAHLGGKERDEMLRQSRKANELQRNFDNLNTAQPLASASLAPPSVRDSMLPPFSIQRQLFETQSLQQQLYQRQLVQQQHLLQQHQLMQQQLIQQQNLIQQLLARQRLSDPGAPAGGREGQHPPITPATNYELSTFASNTAHFSINALTPPFSAMYSAPMPTCHLSSNDRGSGDQRIDTSELASDVAARPTVPGANTSTAEVSQQQSQPNENPEAVIRRRARADEEELQRLRMEHQLRWLSSRNSG